MKSVLNVNMSDASDASTQSVDKKKGKGWRFWAIYISLCMSILLAAVESTVTSTALPFIADELHAGKDYVWFVNSFFLTR